MCHILSTGQVSVLDKGGVWGNSEEGLRTRQLHKTCGNQTKGQD